MTDQKSSVVVKSAAAKACDGWASEYLEQVFGVTLENCQTVKAKQSEITKSMRSEDLAAHLSARFHEIDLAPKDGLVTYHEVERAINNPLLHWTDADIAMLRLLRRYYHTLIELSDDERERLDHGISRHDIDALVSGLNDVCTKVRRKMEDEYESN